jgi:hypothetical protein
MVSGRGFQFVDLLPNMGWGPVLRSVTGQATASRIPVSCPTVPLAL